jgi:hypothetical protein
MFSSLITILILKENNFRSCIPVSISMDRGLFNLCRLINEIVREFITQLHRTYELMLDATSAMASK